MKDKMLLGSDLFKLLLLSAFHGTQKRITVFESSANREDIKLVESFTPIEN
jgi:hypothetical protein